MKRFVLCSLTTAFAFALFNCSGKVDDGNDVGDSGAGDSSISGLLDCTVHEDCIGTSEGCCAAHVLPNGFGCGDATLAVRADKVAAFNNESCGGKEIACPAICMLPKPNRKVACVENKCALVNLDASPMTACTTDDECLVRSKSCCGCSPKMVSEAVAVRKDMSDSFNPLSCNGEAVCGPCTDEAPSVVAKCVSGRCAAVGLQ